MTNLSINLKTVKILILLLISIPFILNSQVHSHNGYYLSSSGMIRFLVVYAEAINDPNDPGDNPNWSVGQMPLNPGYYFDTYFDEGNNEGKLTEYFEQDSNVKLQIVGDYYPYLVQIDYNSYTGTGDNQVMEYLNNLPGNDIITANGFSINSDDFDKW